MSALEMGGLTPRRRGIVRIPTVRKRFRSGRGHGGMRAGGRGGFVTTALVLLALAACSGTPDTTPPSPTPPSTQSPASPTPSPSPSATPKSETEVAAANAEGLIRRYYSVLDGVGADPNADLAQLESVAISKDLDVRKNQYKRWQRDSWVQTGVTKLPEVRVQSVNLDNSDPAGGQVPTVQVDVCFDVSGVDVRDTSGNSVITAERPVIGWIRHTVSNYSWGTDPTGGWRVSTSVDLQQAPCDATS